MFKNEREMLNASQMLDENGVSYIEMTPSHVTVKAEDMKKASTLLSGFDVELKIDRRAVLTAPTVKKEKREVTVTFGDILSLLRGN